MQDRLSAGSAMDRRFTLMRSPDRRKSSLTTNAEGTIEGVEAALHDRRRFRLPPWLENKFEADTGAHQARVLSHATLALAIVYSVVLLGEAALTPKVFRLAAVFHFGLVTPLLLVISAFVGGAANRLSRDALAATAPLLIAAQIGAIYGLSRSDGAAEYVTLIALVATCANAALPLSARAASWVTAGCFAILGASLFFSHAAPTQSAWVHVGALAIAALLTLHANLQRNRGARRAYLLDLRNRLRVVAVGQEARHDPLTGLANRRRLDEVAAQLWSRPSAMVSPVSVVLYDVDRFKAYNDIYGHQAGDACLQAIASCASSEIGSDDDVAARYGGEEFMLLLPRTSLADATRVAERLRTAVVALRIPHSGGDELGLATASFGVASGEIAQTSFATLTAAADAALYAAKRAGRNRVMTPFATRDSQAA